LIETILAVTIFSFIAVGISTSFFSGMKLWGRAINTDYWRNNILLDFESISSELRQSVNVPDIGFSGDVKSVSFPTISGNNIVKITYSFDPLKKTIVRSEAGLKDVLAERISGYSPGKSILSMDEFSVKYLQRDVVKGTSEWKSEWDKEDGIFTAIKFTLKTHDEEFNKTVFIPIAE
jgi:hypothetical protein